MTGRPPRVLILHAYSAENAGDGLLVDEALETLRSALGDTEVTLLASRPNSFAHHGVRTLPTVPTWRGWDRETLRVLRGIDDFDLVLGVGGGYLRAGTLTEAAKAGLVMGPQLLAAARSSAPTVYLPQSIGPARFGTRRWLQRTLRRIDVVMVRDDRSLSEIGGPTVARLPDLATAAVAGGRQAGREVHPTPVLSIRAVHGRVPAGLYELANRINVFDGYTQSTVGGNDDRPAMETLGFQTMLDRTTLMIKGATPRVLIAVRLHAALMALAAGHYVIHLAYERKGFGAYGDLGLEPWVHSVNQFDPDSVALAASRLLTDESVRADYDDRIARSADSLAEARRKIILEIKNRAAVRQRSVRGG